MKKTSPYRNLPATKFWKTGVAKFHPEELDNLYTKKFDILSNDLIATAGSCFAQNIARYLKQYNYNVLNVEPSPMGLSPNNSKKYGYNLYSARYGNIYTARHLLQISQEALKKRKFLTEQFVWENNGKFYDAFRPNVEPEGLDSKELVIKSRLFHIKKVKQLLKTCNVFVFTFGLTEAWIHKHENIVYPMAPGTVCGNYDPEIYSFKNYSYNEIVKDFIKFRNLVKALNPTIKFLLTVSPVPLAATASSDHILSANTYSKSVLRAAAGELSQQYDDIDYFPSYEIIGNQTNRGFFYKSDMREVTEIGVQTVMKSFFDQHKPLRNSKRAFKHMSNQDDIICEEVMLEAFAG